MLVNCFSIFKMTTCNLIFCISAPRELFIVLTTKQVVLSSPTDLSCQRATIQDVPVPSLASDGPRMERPWLWLGREVDSLSGRHSGL